MECGDRPKTPAPGRPLRDEPESFATEGLLKGLEVPRVGPLGADEGINLTAIAATNAARQLP